MQVHYSDERSVKFGDQVVGDGRPTFVTYEAGPTHNSLSSAIELTELASKSGANAIKFQIFDPDKLCADKKQLFEYDILVDKQSGEQKTVSEPLYEILKRRYLTPDEWRKVKARSDELGLAFFATIGFEEDLDLLIDLKCDSVKIASADVNHIPLIRIAAETGMCIQLDTGNADLGEIEKAVDVCLYANNNRVIIHQCPSGYPARIPSINLRIIETLRQMFPECPIAYSDHTPGADMDIAAIMLGANLVEKTITKDRCTPSVEHIFSLEPDEMNSFIRRLRDVEQAMGTTRRILHEQELSKRKKIRRSVFLASDSKEGGALDDLAVEYRRPGDGISPDAWESMKIGMKLRHDLPAGHKLLPSDLERIDA